MRVKQEKQSDLEIIKSVLAGRVDDFAKIIERYQNALLRYVSYLTNSSADKKDIVQETFIKVYRNLNAYNQTLKFSSWIYRIAHNEAINQLKKKKPIYFGDNELYKLDKIKYHKSDVKDIEDKILVNQLLETLPMKYREPLELYYIEERSYDEISDILRMPIGTVGVRIKRGLSQLRIKN